jgi:hypothetical protein
MIRTFAITERSQVAAIELAREDTRVAYPGFLFSVKPGVERLDGPSTLPVFAISAAVTAWQLLTVLAGFL